MVGFRLYAWTLSATGAYRLDLRAIDALRGGPPVVLVPNHPSLIDALLILTRHPNVSCVMKKELMRNVFLGAGSRLARYIPSGQPRQMIKDCVEELGRGGVVLLFPEGTRTTRVPLNPLTGSVGVIAKHARVPVQMVIIETDSPYLSKGWPLFRVPEPADHLPRSPGPALRAALERRRLHGGARARIPVPSWSTRRRTAGWAKPAPRRTTT